MTLRTTDVSVGDDVKNGRSSAWGRVVEVRASPDGRVLSLRVRRHKGMGVLQHEPTWWPASSILMIELRQSR